VVVSLTFSPAGRTLAVAHGVLGMDEGIWNAQPTRSDISRSPRGRLDAESGPLRHRRTRASDLALFQDTSGTTRELPDAVKHTHRAGVTVMIAGLYGLGLRPGDRYFCPWSPACGHGLTHGTISPLALGIHTASYSGKFEAERIFEALQEFGIDNVAAAPTVFRMLRNSGLRDRYRIDLKKLSYTGEPMDRDTWPGRKGLRGHAVQHVWHDRSRRAHRELPGPR
jgi:acyl-coenzyme A synthetase/AMP-(fatty) acid ligase